MRGARGTWRRAREIFELVSDLDPEAARERGVELCEGDRELQSLVESLLRGDAAELDLAALASRAAGSAHRVLEKTLAGHWLGRKLGSFRLLEMIGRGGMGTVFRAEREGAYAQTVAVKILPAALTDEVALARFQQERRVLAGLEHPNVARLLDGGSTEEGIPYLVMEHVDGEPIDEHCDRRALTVDRRVGLFLEVCAAVRHAHRNLVVHRDLKPANILVSAQGRPKLLDFGIAKLLSADGAASDITATVARVVSPGYCSPEQLFGEPISTSTDVYLLGILLYELLAGRRPFQELERRPGGFVAALRSRVPLPASVAAEDSKVAAARGTSPAALTRTLRGDLDAIVARALRVEPQERYESVDALCRDLALWRDGLPVSIRASQRGYRLKKFLRRNALSTSLAAAATVALLAFAVSTSIHSDRMTLERDHALEERLQAEKITELLTRAFESADPGNTQGATVTAQDILEEATVRLRSELAGEPELEAAMLLTVAEVRARLGDLEEARVLREVAGELRHGILSPDTPGLSGARGIAGGGEEATRELRQLTGEAP